MQKPDYQCVILVITFPENIIMFLRDYRNVSQKPLLCFSKTITKFLKDSRFCLPHIREGIAGPPPCHPDIREGLHLYPRPDAPSFSYDFHVRSCPVFPSFVTGEQRIFRRKTRKRTLQTPERGKESRKTLSRQCCS